jgi:hypothetical protein
MTVSLSPESCDPLGRILEDAGLGEDVVRHSLRPTAPTWQMQAGTDLWEAAGWLGMTVEQLEQNYGHHHRLSRGRGGSLRGPTLDPSVDIVAPSIATRAVNRGRAPLNAIVSTRLAGAPFYITRSATRSPTGCAEVRN